MKIRKIKILCVLLTILVMCFSISYAKENLKGNQGGNKNFFSADKKEYTKNENVKLALDLTKIPFDTFEFELKSSNDLSNMQVSNVSDNVKTDKNEISFKLDKTKTDLNNVYFVYAIPSNVNVNDTIKFTATIKNIKDSDKQGKSDASNGIANDDGKSDITKNNEGNNTNPSESNEKNDTISNIVEIKIVDQDQNITNPNGSELVNGEGNNDNNKKGSGKNNEKTDTNKGKGKTQNGNKSRNEVNKNFGGNAKNSAANNENDRLKQQLIYKGSNDNYLNSISVDGYNLNKEFSKDNDTYFVNVPRDITSININTDKEEDNSQVAIYGNTNMTEKLNKVLISVTAQNGEVRYYRIYVTKN